MENSRITDRSLSEPNPEHPSGPATRLRRKGDVRHTRSPGRAEHYDNGDHVFQTSCAVEPNDTPETLAKRVLQLEHLHYPPTIENYFTQLTN